MTYATFHDIFECRYNETVNREQKANCLEDRIKWCRNFVANKRSEFSHISEAQWIQLESECDKAEKSYNEKKKDQESLSKTDDPILTCAFIDKKVNVLDNIVRGIMNTPKPQPKKVCYFGSFDWCHLCGYIAFASPPALF